MNHSLNSLFVLSGLLLTACDSKPPSAATPPQPNEVASAATPVEAASPAATPPSEVVTSGVVPFVKNGVATAVLVVPADAAVREVVDVFRQRVRRATGVELSMIATEGEAPAGLAKVVIRVQGINGDEVTQALAPESYRFRLSGQQLEIHVAAAGGEMRANPRVVSQPLVWALNSILEQGLGARWLWPGELGEYLPKSDHLELTVRDEAVQPELESRALRLLLSRRRPTISSDSALNRQLEQQAIQWSYDHRMGSRSEISFGHSFSHWWEKYSKDHPDYFAEIPKPHVQPFPKPGAVKLRLSNPAVIEQIAKEYEEAGAPRYWNVCPNDGSGFDISKETLEWDLPKGQNPLDIFQARGNLTGRYVKFWNLLYERLKQINPEVELVTYAYSSYRNPPPPERPFTAKAVIQIVDSAEAFDSWKAWAAGGSRLFLRPNWWHQGADAPYINYRKNNHFLRFAVQHGGMGVDMDSILGYWATQGLNYYMTARLTYQPELTDEQMLDEYTEAFGKGAPKIREYFLYWLDLAEKYNYSINAGGDQDAQRSEYQKLVAQGRVSRSILNGSKYVLPYLYTDRVLAPGYALLDEAAALIGDPASEEAQRVEFLRKGLEAMKVTREQVVRGQKLKLNPTAENMAAFVEGRKAMEALREEWSKEHIVWAESTRLYEERYHILLRESALERNQINLDGY